MSLVTTPVQSVTSEELARVASAGTPVRIIRRDGKVAEGVLVVQADGRLKVSTGRAGRPLIVDAVDVVGIAAA